MNDDRLNFTGLSYYHNRAKVVFADKTEVQDVADDLSALSDRVDDIIAEGGEPNVIEKVQKNGVDLTVTNKTVNVTVPTTVAELSDASDYAQASDLPTKTSDLTNDGDGTSNFATESYVDQNGGKIDKIKVNGTEQTITNKTVDITVPTKVSDLTNDSKFQTDTEVEEAIDAKLGSTYKPKGSVAFANLPSATKANEGNVYNITDSFTTTADFVEGAGNTYPAGTNVVIINTSGSTYKYDVLAGFVDLSNYWNSTNLPAITTAQIDTLFS